MAIQIFASPADAGALQRYVQARPDPCAPIPAAEPMARTAHAVVLNAGGDPAAARAIGAAFERDYQRLAGIFGLEPPGLPCTVYAVPGVGGAYHCGCDATTFFVDADARLGAAFCAAELVEVFEAALGNGWDCGATNGEALSRALAAALHPEIAPDLAPTEVGWWDRGAADYLSANVADDRDPDGNGCGTLFLYYLRDGLGRGWEAIARAGGGSLASTYAALTGSDAGEAHARFLDALAPFVDAGQQLILPASGNPWAVLATGS